MKKTSAKSSAPSPRGPKGSRSPRKAGAASATGSKKATREEQILRRIRQMDGRAVIQALSDLGIRFSFPGAAEATIENWAMGQFLHLHSTYFFNLCVQQNIAFHEMDGAAEFYRAANEADAAARTKSRVTLSNAIHEAFGSPADEASIRDPLGQPVSAANLDYIGSLCAGSVAKAPPDLALLSKAIDTVSGPRRAAYGKPEDNFGCIVALWNAYLQRRYGPMPQLDARDHAQMMILTKIARLAQTPDHVDSMLDIAGYAACGHSCQVAAGAESL